MLPPLAQQLPVHCTKCQYVVEPFCRKHTVYYKPPIYSAHYFGRKACAKQGKIRRIALKIAIQRLILLVVFKSKNGSRCEIGSYPATIACRLTTSLTVRVTALPLIPSTASQCFYGTSPLLSGYEAHTEQTPACNPFSYRSRSFRRSSASHQRTVFSPVPRWHR